MMSQFPSPAQDYVLNDLNLDLYLKPNPPATSLKRLHHQDDSMVDIGMMPSCILVIDNSLDPKNGCWVYAVVDRQKIAKTFYEYKQHIELHSENEIKNYPPIVLLKSESDWHIIGVITAYVFKFKY